MIRHQPLTALIRFYNEFSDDPFAPYDAICTLVWESRDVVWLSGMHGVITRAMFRELVQFCVDQNIRLVKAHRASTRRLPFGNIVGDHIEIEVSVAASRILRGLIPSSVNTDYTREAHHSLPDLTNGTLLFEEETPPVRP